MPFTFRRRVYFALFTPLYGGFCLIAAVNCPTATAADAAVRPLNGGILAGGVAVAAANVAQPGPKPAMLSDVRISNDGSGKASCTLTFQDSFDDQGLLIPIDPKQATEAANSLEIFSAGSLTITNVKAPKDDGPNGFRIEPANMTAGQLALRLSELQGTSIIVSTADGKDKTITLASSDATNLTPKDVTIKPIPITTIEQIMPAPNDQATAAAKGGSGPGIVLKTLSKNKVQATVRYSFSTTPWAPNYRVRLSEDAKTIQTTGQFTAFVTIANPAPVDLKGATFSLLQKNAIFKLGQQDVDKGATVVWPLLPFDIEVKQTVKWDIQIRKLDDLIFDTRVQLSGEPAYEAIVLDSSAAASSWLIPGPVEIEDTATAQVFSGKITGVDDLLKPAKHAAPAALRVYRYVRISPVPEAIVNFDGPSFGYIRATGINQFILNVTSGTTIACSTEFKHTGKLIRVLPNAGKGAKVLPSSILLSSGRPAITFTVETSVNADPIDVRAASPLLLRDLLTRQPGGEVKQELRRLVDRLYSSNPSYLVSDD